VLDAMRRSLVRPADRLSGLVLGCAIGDALGMPVESAEPGAALRAIERLGGIKDYLAPQLTALRTLRHLRPGCWTDETQLVLAISRALVASRRVDYDAIAEAFVRTFDSLELRGWDTVTKQACRRLKQGTSRIRSGTIDAADNAVAARIAPIAAISTYRGETRADLLRHCVAVGLMSHRDPRAVVGAYVIGLLVREAIENGRRWEPDATRWDALVDEAAQAEASIARTVGTSNDPISQNLRELSDALDSDPTELAELCEGATSYACHSIPFVAALLYSRAWEFEDGVLAAVNGGGDTDTNGAIVGAVLGTAHGIRRLPKRLADRIEESEVLREVGAALGTIVEP
jgi:ADP-ribosylglycohydrolase